MATSVDASADFTPEWLDRKFVADVLRCEEGEPVTVRQLRVTKAVTKGENYASFLLRVGADYTLGDDSERDSSSTDVRTTSLIVKCLPLGELMQQFLRESGVFERETKMYTTTLPTLEKILEELVPDDKVTFSPKIYPVDREDTIVLQDLREQGFRMADRHAGMDLAHATLVLRRLARLHAASVELHARDPKHVEGYTDVMYVAEKREQVDRFIPQTLERVARVVDAWEEKEPRFAGYADKMRAFALRCVDLVLEDVKPSSTFLNVLNHGDCWVNNVLFRYDDSDGGELRDMRFVDFQVTRYGSPTLDLQYLLYTSVQPDVRETQWKLLLEAYASQLRATLVALGHAREAERITVQALEEDMQLRSSFGVVSSCITLSAVLADPDDAITLDGLTMEDFEKGDTGIFDRALAGDRFNQALKRLLPIFVANGSI